MNYDIVIPLKTDESIWEDNNELKYLLRSLDAYFPVGKIIIVSSGLPSWLNAETVIQVKAEDRFLHHKDANIISKILRVIDERQDLSDVFYWSCDDHLVLRKPVKDELKAFYISELKDELPSWWSGPWKEGMRRTMELLMERGKTTFHYDAHIPQPVNKEKFRKVMDTITLEEHKRWCINTLYLNQAGLKKHYAAARIKASFEKPNHNLSEIQALTAGKLYLNYNNGGLTRQLQEFMINKFPTKSRFEL